MFPFLLLLFLCSVDWTSWFLLASLLCINKVLGMYLVEFKISSIFISMLVSIASIPMFAFGAKPHPIHWRQLQKQWSIVKKDCRHLSDLASQHNVLLPISIKSQLIYPKTKFYSLCKTHDIDLFKIQRRAVIGFVQLAIRLEHALPVCCWRKLDLQMIITLHVKTIPQFH